MANYNTQTRRKEISYFDGVNVAVSSNLVKSNELAYAINVRSDSIGSISKRNGTRRLGDQIVATANYGIFYFENLINNGFYRISKVGATTSIYLLNASATWESYAGNGTSLTAANISHTIAENCCFITNGTDANRYINSTQFFFTITSANATVGATYTNNGITFTVLATIVGATTITMSGAGVPSASGTLTKASGTGDATITFSAYNLNVITAATSTGHLYNSPVAYKINYYKDKLYLGDYTLGSIRYKNGIMMSSKPLGILALVDGDHAAADCGADNWISVTDTKYIYATDTIDVYRGNEKVADITVKAKTENKFQINAITFSGSYTTLDSADEVWVNDTQAGTVTKQFRWAGNPSSGVNVKQYDTFFLSGGQNDSLTMLTNVGDVMLIGNKHNLAVWNNYNLQSMDLGIGCISSNGYIKSRGILYFLDYTGIYKTTGGVPQLISAKIQPYIEGASKTSLEATAMGKKGYSIFCSIGSVTLYYPDGSVRETLSDVVLEYNIQQDSWFVHTGISATYFATYIRSDNIDSLEYADDGTNCNIFEFLRSGVAVDDEVTTNKEILFRCDTNNIKLGTPFESIVYPLEVIVEVERGHSLQCFVSIDDGKFYPLEESAIKGVTIFKITNKNKNESSLPRCRNIAISLRDFSKSLCRITKLAVIYNPTAEDDQVSATNYGQ